MKLRKLFILLLVIIEDNFGICQGAIIDKQHKPRPNKENDSNQPYAPSIVRMSVSLDVPLPALQTSDSINIPLPIKKAVASLQTHLPEQNVSASMTNKTIGMYQDKCRSWLQKLLMDIDEMPRDKKDKKGITKGKTAVVKPISGIKVLIPENQYNPQLVKVIPLEEENDQKKNPIYENQIYQLNLIKDSEGKISYAPEVYSTSATQATISKSGESATNMLETTVNINSNNLKREEKNEEQAIRDFLSEVDSIVVLPSQSKRIPHKNYQYDMRPNKERISQRKLDKNLDNEITKISKSLSQISQKLKDFSDFKIKLLSGTAYVGKVEGKLTKSEEEILDYAKKNNYNKSSYNYKPEISFDPLRAWKSLSTESNKIAKDGKTRYILEAPKQTVFKKLTNPNMTFTEEFFKENIEEQNPPLLMIPGVKKEDLESLSEERVNLSLPENETAFGGHPNTSLWAHYIRKEKEPTLENVQAESNNKWNINTPLFYSASQNNPVFVPVNMSFIEKKAVTANLNQTEMKEDSIQWNISNKIEYITEEGNFNLSQNNATKNVTDTPDVEIFEPVHTSTAIIEIIVSTTHINKPITTSVIPNTTTVTTTTSEPTAGPTEKIPTEKTPQTEAIDITTKGFLVEDDSILSENKTNNISVIPINNTLSLTDFSKNDTNLSNEISPTYHQEDKEDKKLTRGKTAFDKQEVPAIPALSQMNNMIETVGKTEKVASTPIAAESTVSESKIKVIRDERGKSESKKDVLSNSENQFNGKVDDYGGKVWKAYEKDSHTVKRSIDALPTPMGTPISMNVNPKIEFDQGMDNSGSQVNNDFNESATMLKPRRETAGKPKDTKLKQEEFDTFAKNIIAHLKNMPFEEALKLQLKIQALITEERLRFLEECKRQGASCSEVAANFYESIFNMDNYGTFASTTNIEQLNDGVDM